MPFASAFVFNETSPSSPGTAASSQSVTNSTLGGIAWPLDDWDALDVAADIVGATGGTLNIYVQVSPDGINWYDVIAFPQATNGASLKTYQAPLSLATNTATVSQVGKNLNPSLTAGNVVNGAFTDRLRLVMVAGSGTTVGAPVIVRVSGQRVRADEYGR
jgi:hypothetical protein